MAKKRIESNAFLYPMPMAIVGAMVEERPNFLAVAWATRVNGRPPMIGVALARNRYTNVGIVDTGAFSVNVPGEDLLEATDWVGIVSGRKADKSNVFRLFYGDGPGAPMIEGCPLTMECRLAETVELPTNIFFIGEIVSAWCDEEALSEGKPDPAKIRPFTLTMPDNGYWSLGRRIGTAWSAGKGFGKG